MSIPVQTPFNLYIANGSTTVFPYRFLLAQASDLRVTVNGKAVSSGFSVSGEGNQSGGQVTFSTPPTNGTRIAILRNIPLRRDTEYQDNGDLLASTINADFDRLWMAVQGVDAATNLALSRSGQDVDYYDAKGMPVTNLKDPVNPQDAVTKKVFDVAVLTMGQQVNDAKKHLDVVNQSVLQNALKAQQAQVQVEQKIDDASKEVTEKIESQLAQGINTTTQNVASTKANADAAEGSAIASHQSEVNALGSEQAAGKHAQDAANILTQITLTETEIQQQATGVSSAKNEIDLKAAEVLQAKQDIDKNAASAKISETNSAQYEQGAKQALSEVQKEINAHGGIPGKSAYEIWKDNQPAGSDTSLIAYMDYQKGKPGKNGTSADLTGILTPYVSSADLNTFNKYPLYGVEAYSAQPNHPIPGSSGNDSWGVMWVNPRTNGIYPAQIFMNYNAKIFTRIKANYGWSPWWQITGEPVSGAVGTQVFCSCNIAVSYGSKVSGGALTPAQTGTWFAQGAAGAGEKIMFMKVK
ncbi:hypothetical protein JR782_002778 [Salmonella enterica subsp. enterica serovar Eastbourne]|nr:hypothetical protein [Salmonella enterica subsp. enterica serovar Eastbourne]EHC5907880.1 hypothetical protein [Salmonella enterica subsp. enterica serovar Eastbourne]